MVWKRVRSALVLAPIVFLAAWFGGPFYAIVVALIALLGALELYGMVGLPRSHPLTWFALLCVVLTIVLAHYEGLYMASLLAAAAVLLFIWLLLGHTPKGRLTKWLWLMAGIIYLGWMFSRLIPLRELPDGRDWVILTLFTIFATDTAAFFVGRTWGRHRMAPKISPGKTWEGAVGGFAGAVAAAVILAAIMVLPLAYWQIVVIGILIAVFSQLGDLAESKLKRVVGVKDSGRLIPGHGGMLDRLDSVVFTIVVVYYYVIWVLL